MLVDCRNVELISTPCVAMRRVDAIRCVQRARNFVIALHCVMCSV